MEYIRRNIFFSLLLHVAGIAVVWQVGISYDNRIEQLINVSLFEEADTTEQAGEKNLSPALPLKQESRQSGIKKILRPQAEKILKNSSDKPVVQESVRLDKHTEEVLAPAVNLQSQTESIGPGNKEAFPSAENTSGTYRSPSVVLSVSAMQGSGSGGYGKRGQEPSDSFRQAIHNAIQRNLVYPYIARKRRMEGTVLVEFKINQRGVPEDFRIVRSSGHSILDAAAKETVVKASPFPAAGNTIEIPITFLLKDDR